MRVSGVGWFGWYGVLGGGFGMEFWVGRIEVFAIWG